MEGGLCPPTMPARPPIPCDLQCLLTLSDVLHYLPLRVPSHPPWDQAVAEKGALCSAIPCEESPTIISLYEARELIKVSEQLIQDTGLKLVPQPGCLLMLTSRRVMHPFIFY